jgi:polyribonucleotide 5'-hydroxyl-kinase
MATCGTRSSSLPLRIFTQCRYGAELQVWGAIASSYISSETAMPLYANLHQRLEARREEARVAGLQGPRVIVVGPTDSGKSSLCRILCSYACRLGRAPTFVDLDLGQGEISLPGTLAATPVDRACLTVEDDAGGGGSAKLAPLAFYFGHASPGDYTDVLRNAQGRLADCVNRRLAADAVAGASGLVINTMGWIDAGGYDIILDAIRAFRADVVLVLGNDRVFARLTEDVRSLRFPLAPAPAAVASGGGGGASGGETGEASGAARDASLMAVASSSAPAPGHPGFVQPVIAVVKLPRSGGVVERSRESRQAARKGRVHEYFYGPPSSSSGRGMLSPHSTTVSFDDVTVVKVGGVASEAGILPIGRSSTLDPLRVTVIAPTSALLNHVLAVSYATSEVAVPHVNVAGFVHV